MKNSILFVTLYIPIFVFAENYPGFDPQQMQDMMQKAQDMQTCMKNVDQTELRSIEQRGKQMEAEVKSLCAAGKRSQALNKAMAFAKEVVKSPAMQEIKKCGEMMQGMVPDYSEITEAYMDDNADYHICDNLE